MEELYNMDNCTEIDNNYDPFHDFDYMNYDWQSENHDSNELEIEDVKEDVMENGMEEDDAEENMAEQDQSTSFLRWDSEKKCMVLNNTTSSSSPRTYSPYDTELRKTNAKRLRSQYDCNHPSINEPVASQQQKQPKKKTARKTSYVFPTLATAIEKQGHSHVFTREMENYMRKQGFCTQQIMNIHNNFETTFLPMYLKGEICVRNAVMNELRNTANRHRGFEPFCPNELPEASIHRFLENNPAWFKQFCMPESVSDTPTLLQQLREIQQNPTMTIVSMRSRVKYCCEQLEKEYSPLGRNQKRLFDEARKHT